MSSLFRCEKNTNYYISILSWGRGTVHPDKRKRGGAITSCSLSWEGKSDPYVTRNTTPFTSQKGEDSLPTNGKNEKGLVWIHTKRLRG